MITTPKNGSSNFFLVAAGTALVVILAVISFASALSSATNRALLRIRAMPHFSLFQQMLSHNIVRANGIQALLQ